MDDSGIDRAASEFIVKVLKFIRGLHWKRFVVGIAIYAAIMLIGYPIFFFVALNLVLMGAKSGKGLTWAIIAYAITAICCAVWGSARLVRRREK